MTVRDSRGSVGQRTAHDASGEDGDAGSLPTSARGPDFGSGRADDNAGIAGRISSGSPVQAHEVAVSVSGLRKRFGEGPKAVTAVREVTFDIERGSIVGLLGPNGAGKTTLIKSVLGMVLPDEGSVRIRGIDVNADPRAAYAYVDAMLEGARNDYWRLTVWENLRYFATISGVDPDSVRARHERLLERLELTEKADVPVRDLSRGMKQKVSLASVLAGGAEVVFLDEPTLGLDIESSRTLQRELRRLAEEEGLTVLLSSHNMDVVETVCDRVLIMSEGEIVADDTVDALLQGTDLHRVQITSRDLGPELVAALRTRFDVDRVDVLETGARIEITTDSDGLYELMERLRAEGVALERVRTIEPDLEDVFVGLTSPVTEGEEERR